MMTREPQTFQSEQLTNYRVRLPAFEGPLDLLLHLIKKNEINIYDIPIALIARQYLEYLSLMESLNLNIAGEFLVMAATLIHIKSRMLLPPDDLLEEEQEEDPRRDLVQRLLEYQRFKDAAERLRWREETWCEVFRRQSASGGNQVIEAEDEVMLSEISLYDLMEALQALLARVPRGKVLEITPDGVSVRERMSLLMERLEEVNGLAFEALFEGQWTRAAVIVTFLALLELMRLQLVVAQQVRLFGPIRILKAPENNE